MVSVTGEPAPAASPDQPANRQPTLGVAVTVSTIPYVAVAVTGSTLPLPGGATSVVSVYRIWLKVAVTALLSSMVSVTGEPAPVPVPNQPSNCQPITGVTLSVTTAP